ncbi:MAG: dihydroorotate dehydrogenase [Planctomycetota bacterium]
MPALQEKLQVDLAGMPLRNPVMLAAGTAGTLDETADVLPLDRIGGLVTKSITREPREGNPTWRVAPLPGGMLNAIGLANVGVEAFVRDFGPRVASVPTTVIASVAGTSVDDYVHVVRRLGEVDGLASVELNVSCPNVHGGVEFGVDMGALSELVAAVRDVDDAMKIVVKLSPVAVGRPGIVELATAAIDHGADALALANTVPAMAIDVRTRRPLIANVTGGLSGPAVHPIVVKLVHEVYRGVAKERGVSIIGIGGVMGWREAAEFILAGATAVQVGTLTFVQPRAAGRIARGLERWVRDQDVRNISELVGAVDLTRR